MNEKLYTFTCGICEQNKQHQKLNLARVNGIGIDPYKIHKICDNCIKKVNIIKEKTEEEFF